MKLMAPAPDGALGAWSVALLFVAALTLGCGSKELDGGDPGDAPAQGGRSGTIAESVSAELFPDGALVTAVFTPKNRRSATALAFNPRVPGELWAVLRQFPLDAPCTMSVASGCSALQGEVAVISGADTPTPIAVVKRDANAWHFMRRPTSIAFGDNGNLATCPEARTGNYDDEVIDFVGPTLWSSDPAIFGVPAKSGQNGTHLDMLHETPFCMGIAHEVDNAYWTFNGQIGALDRYDFHAPHVIGGEDHTDGDLHRYVEGELLRVPEVPSHLVLDKESGFLYVADTGHARVVRLDIATGSVIGEVEKQYDGMAVYVRMGGASLSTFVPAGTVSAPSGIALYRGLVLVTDNADGKIYAFDDEGKAVRSFETGLPAGAIAGIAVGPDGRVYFTNLATGEVNRVAAPG